MQGLKIKLSSLLQVSRCFWCRAVTHSKLHEYGVSHLKISLFLNNGLWLNLKIAPAWCWTINFQHLKCLWVPLLACCLTFSFFVSPFFFLTSHNLPPPLSLPTGPITPFFNLGFKTFSAPSINTYKYTHAHHKVKTWSAMTVQLQGLIICPQLFMRFCGRARLRIRLRLLLSNRTMKTSSWNKSRFSRRTQLKKMFSGQRHCFSLSFF